MITDERSIVIERPLEEVFAFVRLGARQLEADLLMLKELLESSALRYVA
jgi:hypothetical protein